MRITSINKEHSTSMNKVALNLDEPVPDEVAKRVKVGVLRLTFDGTVLIVGVPPGDARLNGRTMAALNDAIAIAFQQVEEEKMHAKRELDRLHSTLAQMLALPLD